LVQPLAIAHEAWDGLPISLMPLPSNSTVTDMAPEAPSLAVARSGRGKRRYRLAGRERDLYTSPDMVELYGAGFHIEQGHWEGDGGELVALQFPRVPLRRLLQDEADRFVLPTRLEQFDKQLTGLAFALWDEARNGSPAGPLYSQGLTIAMLGLLMDRHGAVAAKREAPVRAFSAPERTRLLAFIDAELTSPLTLDELAAVVGMGPRHFTRVFKTSFQCSAHAFIVQRRIEAACRDLRRQPQRSLADIAASTGFASQSHFTEAFRRALGTTPARWRREG
jgi:AraC family transcriptional regulator